jgi:hypothetical protein
MKASIATSEYNHPSMIRRFTATGRAEVPLALTDPEPQD